MNFIKLRRKVRVAEKTVALVIAVALVFLGAALVPTFAYAAVDPSSCPFTTGSGSYVIALDTTTKLWDAATAAAAQSEVSGLNIPAGTYEVSLYSYDSYAERNTVSQPNESWFLKLQNGSTLVAQSNAIDDLEDFVVTATKQQVVNTALVVGSAVNKAVAFHAAYPGSGSSVVAVCALLKDVTPPANEKPTITLLGNIVMSISVGSTFTDPGATVSDPEDGNITHKLVTAGTVDANTVGTYTITYNATDTQNLAADQKTRTVNVNPLVTQCNDGIDNDGDGKIDFGTATTSDSGCDDPNDNYENNKPVITLLGQVAMSLVVGSTFTDPGATVSDPEDGNITHKLVTAGTVDANTVGTYTITYNATDTQNLAADQKTRTVSVVAAGCTTDCGGGGGSTPPQCSDGADNDGDGFADYPRDPGCDNSLDDDERDTPPPTGSPATLNIFNERISSSTATSVTVTWNTNISATSRVVYGLDPVSSLGSTPLYGYGLSTATNTALTTAHSMTIEGLPSAASVYLRPVSTEGTQIAVGIELVRGGVLGETTECNFLRTYMRLGYNNDPTEVTKLQGFLRTFEGFSNLQVTGFFDITTDRAVREFQDKYKTDVLDPWKLPGNTGYVYYTTQKKINEIYCKRMFPLNAAQEDEITKFRSLMESLKTQGGIAPTTSVVGAATTPRGATTPAPESDTVIKDKNEALATETPAEENGRIDLSDLLATMPVEDLSDTKVATPGGEVAGTSTKRGLASVIESIGERMEWSTETVYTVLILLVLALLLGIYLIRRYYVLRTSEGE